MPRQLRIAPSATRYDTVALTGGLDLLTPTLQLKPGYVRDAINWECSITGGYTRIGGYERYDGHQAFPSIATYDTMTVAISGVLAVGNAIVGGTSAATGTIISISADSVVAYTQQTGVFVAGENINVAAVTQATLTALGGTPLAADASFDSAQKALAANVYRALIGAVPGSGDTRGVAKLNGVVYAWRDNAGATAMAIYKSTSAGWVLVPLLNELAFTAGGTAYTVGSTVTQGGVSATVKQVALQSGAWGGTAVGRLIITNPTGGNFAAGAIAGSVGTATAAGVQTAITMSPGGRVQTDLGNFAGVVKLYGCDNVNRGFEFDGTVYAPIITGNTPDVPKTVMVHKDHVFFGFDTNYQHSGITTPFTWSALAGSAAYRVNDTITVMQRQPGDQSSGAASISTRTSTYMHYGSSASNFTSTPFEESAGARAYAGQRLGGQSLVFANLGVFSLSATQSFGNFIPASMTMRIRPFTEQRKDQCTGSAIDRTKSQYRLFFSDGFGLYLTILNGRLMGAMPVNFPNPVTCCVSQGGDVDGKDSAFFGSSGGFVYRLDSGTSQDGTAISSYMVFTPANQGNSRIEKRYRGAAFEVQGTDYATFSCTWELGYGEPDRVQGFQPQSVAAPLAPTTWDSPISWDTSFSWDSKSLSPSHVEMKGTGVNVAMRIESNSDAYQQFTLNSKIIHWSPLKALKK